MNYIQTQLSGVWILKPNVIADTRGYFYESYQKEEFDRRIGSTNFIQDNQSRSAYGVLRGLHYQKGADAQAKLVRVIEGSVLDVAVDLRRSSETFGQHVAVELSGDNQQQLFIPRGFAHGFVVLSKTATFIYKVDNRYAPQSEASIRFDDPQLNIDWGIPATDFLLSDKDREAAPLAKAVLFD